MQIELLDITSQYLQNATRQREQAYFDTYPALFRHYYQYWAIPGDLVHLTEHAVQEKVALIKSRLPFLEQEFTRKGFTDIVRVVLFVGANTTNGHAFWDGDSQAFVVWLPVEAYATPLQVDVFVTHEMIHALHYTRNPDFYFQDKKTKYMMGRQIITEGIATWGTQFITGKDDVTVLWSDYVLPSFAMQWYRRCRAQSQEMARRILDEWNESREENEWFSLWDENDVTRYRGGYYVGLEVIRKACEEQAIDLHTLLALEKREVEIMVLRVLREMATGGS